MTAEIQCKERYVYDRRTMGTVRCSKKVWRDGICKIHHPDNQAFLEKGKMARHTKRVFRDDLAKAQNCTQNTESMIAARKNVGLYTLAEARAAIREGK